MLTKTQVTHEQVVRLVAPLGEATRVEPLSGGMFASVLRADLADGRRVVVKVTGSDTSRLLRYEHGILGTEAEAYRIARAAGLPVPAVLLHDTSRTHVDGDALVATFLDGDLWGAHQLDGATARAARRSLGGFMARLHTLTGDEFGYPAPESALTAATWPDAFAAMVGAVVDDADRWGVDLPGGRLLDAVERHRDLLATVTTPRLVHSDLWPGNLLLGPVGLVTGVIDAERSLWGDPLFELVGADQLGIGAVDADLLAGYREAGGVFAVGDGTPGSGDPGAWARISLYRAYYAALLVVEAVPRGYEGDWVAGHVGLARANLEQMLAALRS